LALLDISLRGMKQSTTNLRLLILNKRSS